MHAPVWERAVAFERHTGGQGGLKHDEGRRLQENGPGREGQSKEYRVYSEGNRELWKDCMVKVHSCFQASVSPPSSSLIKPTALKTGFVAAWNREDFPSLFRSYSQVT